MIVSKGAHIPSDGGIVPFLHCQGKFVTGL